MELSGGGDISVPSHKHNHHRHRHHHHHHHRHRPDMKYGYRSRKVSSKSLLRRRRRTARSRPPRLYPAPEFKTVYNNPSSWQFVGQVAGNNANGAYGNRVDPQIAPGTGNGYRIGNWATLKSMFFDFQFVNQDNATIDNRLIIDVWLMPQGPLKNPTESNEVTSQSDVITATIYESNRLITAGSDATPQWNCIDIGSRKNERNSNKFRLLHREFVTIPGKQDPTQHARMVRSQFYVNKMVKMQWSTSDYPDGALTETYTFCDNLGIYLCVRADLGNSSSTENGNANVPIQDALTGVKFNYAIKTKYYDN